jgi:Protein of unknown function (DUF3631)
LELDKNGPPRAALNSGHRRGGSVMRFIKGRAQLFSTYTPMALAAIGVLPLPIIARSIVIPMERDDGAESLKRFNPDDPRTIADMNTIFRVIFDWARTITLDLDPKCRRNCATAWPTIGALCFRLPMLAACGDEAREAALTFNRTIQDENLGVLLLYDIRDIFHHRRVDRPPSSILVKDLADLDDGLWMEWQGRRGQRKLSGMLRLFGIHSKTVWCPMPRNSASRNCKGFLREQFERAWRAYCPQETTHPTHARQYHTFP